MNIEKAIDTLKIECAGDSEGMELAKHTAIEALKKQLPIEPIGSHTNCKCPICGRRVRSGMGSSSRTRDNFCQRCGQAMLWQ